MSDSPTNPHDTYFRRVLARPADAACELRAVLPEPIAARVDWAVLEPQSCTFVSAELRSRYTDILYRTRLSGHDAFIYLLLEHQSTVDRLMAFRMLGYLVDIWRHYVRHHPDARTLPPIIPLVVHNNSTRRRWSAATDIYDLLDLDQPARNALDPWLPRLRFLLDDVATLDLRELRARDLTAATLVMLVLQQIAPGNTHLDTDMKPLLGDLRTILNGPTGIDDLTTVVTYILTVGDTLEADLELLIAQLGPQAKEAIMTTAERLRAEGEARGEARGRAEGEARGRAEALLELLSLKFGSLPDHVVRTVRGADSAQVRAWSGLILRAATLDEVFGRN